MAEETTQAAPAAARPSAAQAPETFRAILGEKVGMTQMFHPKTKALCGVTIVKTSPCRVVRIKTAEGPDGYAAVQLSYGACDASDLARPQRAVFEKAGLPPARIVREVRVARVDGLGAGQIVAAEKIFKTGDYVDVSGRSKGKGFAGVMKRHGFRGLPASHGASDKQRSPGSLTSRRALGRVLPGQRMAGHMGAVAVTSPKIEVIKVEPEQGLVYLDGPVPGPAGNLVVIRETVKSRKFRREPQKPAVRKDKMGNIIQPAKKPTPPKK